MADSTSNKNQIYVNRLLNKGFVYSIIWLMGFGSLISILSALKAKKIMDQSQGALRGKFRLWWCFIVGGAGVLFWFPLILFFIYNAIRNT